MKVKTRDILIVLLRLAGLLTGLLLLVWIGAHFFTANSQLARAIAWLDSDIMDYTRFPARGIENAGPTFYFKQPTEEMKQRYAHALESITYIRDGQAVTENLDEFLLRTDTVAFLVIEDDIVLYEGYFNGYTHDSTVTSFSTAKSFDSALVGIAISEGYIDSIEDPITKYIPELLEKDARYSNIKLRNLLSMSSGINYEEFGLPWSDDATTYYSPNLRLAALSSPIDGEPGMQFLYNNYHPLLIGLVLERATHQPVAKYLEEKIWKPLGMEAPGSWSLDSEADGFEKMESGLNGRAVDFAKFGRLYLNLGNWNGVQIIPADWVQSSTALDTITDPAPNYQYFWWVNDKLSGKHHYYAAGKHGQYIYIVPEQRLILVRYGKTDPLHGGFKDIFEALADQIGKSER